MNDNLLLPHRFRKTGQRTFGPSGKTPWIIAVETKKKEYKSDLSMTNSESPQGHVDLSAMQAAIPRQSEEWTGNHVGDASTGPGSDGNGSSGDQERDTRGGR
jgi:hypothetical protein